MEAFHVLPTPLFWLRVLFIAGGIVVFLFAWNTSDSIWSPFYWLDRLRGGSGDINIHLQQDGGMTRGKYIILGILMVLLGVFGESWLKYVAK